MGRSIDMILQRILEQGKTAKKLGYDPKYCAFTMVDLHALMEQHAWRIPTRRDRLCRGESETSRYESMAQSVLGNRTGFEKLQQIVWAARF